jgi:hypothetical protein
MDDTNPPKAKKKSKHKKSKLTPPPQLDPLGTYAHHLATQLKSGESKVKKGAVNLTKWGVGTVTTWATNKYTKGDHLNGSDAENEMKKLWGDLKTGKALKDLDPGESDWWEIPLERKIARRRN